MIPPVKIDNSFNYLGKEYSFDIKETLLKDLNQYMEVIDRLPLHRKNKIMIVSRFIFTANLGGTYRVMRYMKLRQSKTLTR